MSAEGKGVDLMLAWLPGGCQMKSDAHGPAKRFLTVLLTADAVFILLHIVHTHYGAA